MKNKKLKTSILTDVSDIKDSLFEIGHKLYSEFKDYEDKEYMECFEQEIYCKINETSCILIDIERKLNQKK